MYALQPATNVPFEKWSIQLKLFIYSLLLLVVCSLLRFRLTTTQIRSPGGWIFRAAEAVDWVTLILLLCMHPVWCPCFWLRYFVLWLVEICLLIEAERPLRYNTLHHRTRSQIFYILKFREKETVRQYGVLFLLTTGNGRNVWGTLEERKCEHTSNPATMRRLTLGLQV